MMIATFTPIIAAAGYSMIYLLFGEALAAPSSSSLSPNSSANNSTADIEPNRRRDCCPPGKHTGGFLWLTSVETPSCNATSTTKNASASTWKNVHGAPTQPNRDRCRRHRRDRSHPPDTTTTTHAAVAARFTPILSGLLAPCLPIPL